MAALASLALLFSIGLVTAADLPGELGSTASDDDPAPPAQERGERPEFFARSPDVGVEAVPP